MSAVVVILLMFCAVIVMVKRVDNDREQCAILASPQFEGDGRLNSQAQVLSEMGISQHFLLLSSTKEMVLPLPERPPAYKQRGIDPLIVADNPTSARVAGFLRQRWTSTARTFLLSVPNSPTTDAAQPSSATRSRNRTFCRRFARLLR